MGCAEILSHSSKLMTRYYTNTSLEEMLDAVGKVETSDNNSPAHNSEVFVSHHDGRVTLSFFQKPSRSRKTEVDREGLGVIMPSITCP